MNYRLLLRIGRKKKTNFYGPIFYILLRTNLFYDSKISPELAKPTISLALVLIYYIVIPPMSEIANFNWKYFILSKVYIDECGIKQLHHGLSAYTRDSSSLKLVDCHLVCIHCIKSMLMPFLIFALFLCSFVHYCFDF